MGSWTGAVKFAVKLRRFKIYSVGFSFSALNVNGHIKQIKNGITKLSKRAVIKRNGSKITFSTNDGEEVDFVSFGSFFNVYVRSNVEVVSGICSHQFTKSKMFSHPKKRKNCTHKKSKMSKKKIILKTLYE